MKIYYLVLVNSILYINTLYIFIYNLLEKNLDIVMVVIIQFKDKYDCGIINLGEESKEAISHMYLDLFVNKYCVNIPSLTKVPIFIHTYIE